MFARHNGKMKASPLTEAFLSRIRANNSDSRCFFCRSVPDRPVKLTVGDVATLLCCQSCVLDSLREGGHASALQVPPQPHAR